MSWVEDRLGITLDTEGAPTIELGLRRNPRRAHLLVSRLLGKHVPVPVGDVLEAGRALGVLARKVCGTEEIVAVGFAETATGLGDAVAGRAPYLHTTRRPVPVGVKVLEVREAHSHAPDHLLAVPDEGVLADGRPLVLVDDELSTGRTALDAIRVLQEHWPRSRYVLAALVDARPEDAAAVRFPTVALQRATVTLPADVVARAADLVASLPGSPPPAGAPVPVREAALGDVLDVAPDARTLVLGDEEFMAVPQRVAAGLGPQVRTSTTTRSPAAVVDEPGYPLRTALEFPSTEDGHRATYAYNVLASRHDDPGNAPGFDDIVLVTDQPFTEPLVALLRRCARRGVTVVRC